MFDPGKPLVATSSFAAGDRMVAAGEVFDWRAHRMLPVEVMPLVAAGLLAHHSVPAPSPVSTSPAPPSATQAHLSDRHAKRRR